MPTPAVTLKFRRFRRRFGIAAPRVTVRSHIGWPWYATGLVLLVAMIAGIVWSLAQRGEASELVREIRELRQQLGDRNEELMRLRAGAATEQNAVQMERSAQYSLVSRIKELELENARLKEDVSVYERLIRECPRKSGAGRPS